MRVVGHRGLASATAPPNTFTAVAAALAVRADGVQVDVRLTADRVPVCCSAGLLAGTTLHIESCRFRDVEEVLLLGGHRIPRLDDVIDFVSRRGVLFIHLPEQTRG